MSHINWRIDDYERLDVIGEGGFGAVFEAHDRRTGESVAVKWIRGDNVGEHDPPDMNALTCEVGCNVACCSHPSIVEIVDVVEDGDVGDMFLIMELASASIIHHDIKPDNVLIGPDGELKLCDFRAATLVRPLYEEPRVGTLLYTSPEQLAGDRNYDMAVDMWALDCISSSQRKQREKSSFVAMRSSSRSACP
ncbi:hypothetical protein E2562_016415 [Oryza meyeriana var. granulata]|uniref:[RNA-polymerase]-subunit kinase n=1 Tax=Oryza meyeriana var. granulata TaxID=110450 RepID=A0A6G1EX17_9ORYZ|nr:hypothetical protein E2562_016415 [Oryza meyeriana var. granulata]